MFFFFKYWGIIQIGIVFFSGFWFVESGMGFWDSIYLIHGTFFFTAIIWVGHLSLCETNHGKILPGIRGENLCDSRTKTSSSVELEEGMTPEPPEPNKATKKSRDGDRGSVVHRGSKVWCWKSIRKSPNTQLYFRKPCMIVIITISCYRHGIGRHENASQYLTNDLLWPQTFAYKSTSTLSHLTEHKLQKQDTPQKNNFNGQTLLHLTS